MVLHINGSEMTSRMSLAALGLLIATHARTQEDAQAGYRLVYYCGTVEAGFVEWVIIAGAIQQHKLENNACLRYALASRTSHGTSWSGASRIGAEYEFDLLVYIRPFYCRARRR